MKPRRGLVGFPEIAGVLGKSLNYVYWLSCQDAAFPPVEKNEGARKLFNRDAVIFYKRHCGRVWYRAREK
jgi:hypothetical protein